MVMADCPTSADNNGFSASPQIIKIIRYLNINLLNRSKNSCLTMPLSPTYLRKIQHQCTFGCPCGTNMGCNPSCGPLRTRMRCSALKRRKHSALWCPFSGEYVLHVYRDPSVIQLFPEVRPEKHFFSRRNRVSSRSNGFHRGSKGRSGLDI